MTIKTCILILERISLEIFFSNFRDTVSLPMQFLGPSPKGINVPQRMLSAFVP